MNNTGVAYATKSMPKSNNNKSILNDIYITLYEIKGILYNAEVQRITISDYNYKIKEFESKLFSTLNGYSNYKLADLYIEANTLKNDILSYYNLCTAKPEFNSKEDTENRYNTAFNNMKYNNSLVEGRYKKYINDKDYNKKYKKFRKVFIPSVMETLVLTVTLPLAGITLTPLNTVTTNTYLSKTNTIETTQEKGLKFLQTKRKNLIKIYGELVNNNRQIIEHEIQGMSLDDAIIKAESLLEVYNKNNKDSNDDNTYYEIITNDYDCISLIFLVLYAVTIPCGFVASCNIDDSSGILLTRIYENLKARIVLKKDYINLIKYIKNIKEKNNELANEIYSLFIEGLKNEDLDLLYTKIEETSNKPDEYLKLVKQL